MEIAAVFELGQGEELLPIEGEGILDVSMNLKLPFIQRDFWPDAEIECGKVVNLSLAGRESVSRPNGRAFFARHFARPAFFCRDICFLHQANRLPESLEERQQEVGTAQLRYGSVQARIQHRVGWSRKPICEGYAGTGIGRGSWTWRAESWVSGTGEC